MDETNIFKGINFDKLAKIAKSRPMVYERFRRLMISSEIRRSSPEQQHRLKGMQFQIDNKRELSKHPMQTCIQLSNMMHDSLQYLQDICDNPEKVRCPSENKPAAKILKFSNNSH